MVDAVHATTQEQLIAALLSDTSEIVVEGTPQFIDSLDHSMAMVKASGKQTIPIIREREQVAPRLKPFLIAFICFFAVFFIPFVLFEILISQPIPYSYRPDVHPLTTQGNIIISLAWAFVSLAITTMIFLLVRRAMSQEYNVEWSWTVTKYATGKLVLSKTQTRTKRTRKKG
jgi:uncharacterized membrane protein YhaH (DUF805 family)